LRATPAGTRLPIIVWTVRDLDASERRALELSSAALVFKREGGTDTLIAALHRMLPLKGSAPEGAHGG